MATCCTTAMFLDPVALSVLSSRMRRAISRQERLEFIKTWGPRGDTVDQYPTHGESYTICPSSISPSYPTRCNQNAIATGYFFISVFQCPRRVQRIGRGKWACGLGCMAKQDKCVIYSFGPGINASGRSSFELPLLECASCRVWGCDYSVNSWGLEITGGPELRRRTLLMKSADGATLFGY
ncbi:hypothetical protein EDB85DRAFT_1971588 [Lactarius pseudohatsudake]|nr:hypothetical protein EDB85DRAFT_1971588 [Lactarius pseudohatsudake]